MKRLRAVTGLLAIAGCERAAITDPPATFFCEALQATPDTLAPVYHAFAGPLHFAGCPQVFPLSGVWTIDVQVAYRGSVGEHLVGVQINRRSVAIGELFSPDSVDDFVAFVSTVDTVAAGDTLTITGGSLHGVYTVPAWSFLRLSH